MYENAHIQTVAVDLSRRLEQESSISRASVRKRVGLLKGKIKRSALQL